MLNILKHGIAPLLSLFILMSGAGIMSTFLPVRINLEGYSSVVAGFVTSAYFMGFIIGSLRIERFISRVGHARAFAACASFVTVCTMAMALHISPIFWAMARFFTGIFMSGLFIIVESWLLKLSANGTRGVSLSLYMIAFYGGQSGGQFVLAFADINTLVPFCIIAFLSSFSVIPVSMTKARLPAVEDPSLLAPWQLYRISPFAVLSAILSGMMISSFFGLAPIFAQKIGLSMPEIANFMGLTILGGFLLQWPIGQLSDKISRKLVLISVSFITCILAFLVATFSYFSTPLLYLMAVAFGGFSFTIYPLSISHINDYLPSKDLLAATGGMLLAYGFGSVLGPLIAPYFMQFFGPIGLFVYLTSVSCTLGFIGLWRQKKRVAIPLDQQRLFLPLPRTTLQVGGFDPEMDPVNVKEETDIIATPTNTDT